MNYSRIYYNGTQSFNTSDYAEWCDLGYATPKDIDAEALKLLKDGYEILYQSDWRLVAVKGKRV